MTNNILNKFSLKNKKVFVIGGCGLIGSPISEAILSASAELYVLDNDKKRGNYLQKKFRDFKFKYIYYDLSRINTFDKRFKNIIKKYGCPNVFINCSYPTTRDWKNSNFDKNKISILRKNIDIHLNTHSWISYSMCEIMKKNKIKGSVILFGSIYGIVGQSTNLYKKTNLRENMNYSIIKGGLITLTKQLASYYGQSGIRVNIICPGGIEGNVKGKKIKQPLNFMKNYSKQSPLRRLGKPEEIAPSALFLSSEASSYITGTIFLVDGGWTSI